MNRRDILKTGAASGEPSAAGDPPGQKSEVPPSTIL